MKTAREWFQCLRPDLRDRAIKATKKEFGESRLSAKYNRFSHALIAQFSWAKDRKIRWRDIHDEALDIEQGRKPDIK